MDRRCFIVFICAVQVLSTLVRLVFDFLGYLWLPIIASFVHLVFVLIGLFAAYQLRRNCAIVYVIWQFIWIGWNTFLICFYLQIGHLDRDSTVPLSLGTGKKSWFLEHGIGCRLNGTNSERWENRAPPENMVTGCVLAYYWVEVIQAAIQDFFCILAVIGMSFFIYWIGSDEHSELVKGELEFIKMHHKSPTRGSQHPSEDSPFNTLATTLPSLSVEQLDQVGDDLGTGRRRDRLRNGHHHPLPSLPPPSHLSAATLLQQQRANEEFADNTHRSTAGPVMRHSGRPGRNGRNSMGREHAASKRHSGHSDRKSVSAFSDKSNASRGSRIRDPLPWVTVSASAAAAVQSPQTEEHSRPVAAAVMRSDSDATEQLPPYSASFLPRLPPLQIPETHPQRYPLHHLQERSPSELMRHTPPPASSPQLSPHMQPPSPTYQNLGTWNLPAPQARAPPPAYSPRDVTDYHSRDHRFSPRVMVPGQSQMNMRLSAPSFQGNPRPLGNASRLQGNPLRRETPSSVPLLPQQQQRQQQQLGDTPSPPPYYESQMPLTRIHEMQQQAQQQQQGQGQGGFMEVQGIDGGSSIMV